MKRFAQAFILVFALVALATAFSPAASATYYYVDITSYDTFRTATMGNAYDIDGESGYQCWDGAALLWQQVNQSLFTGDGTAAGCWRNCAWDNAGANFTLIYNLSEVKRGDVVVFDYSSSFPAVTDTGVTCGHIAFADNDYTPGIGFNIYGQNQLGHGEFTVQWDVNTSSFLGAFRLNRWAVPVNYADLTEARQTYIMPADNTDLALAVDPANNNVRLEARADKSTQMWSFEKQGDESYIITSLYNGMVLDVSGGDTADGTNVWVYPRWPDANSAQRWYAYQGNGGINFATKLNTGKRLDINGGSLTSGTNLQIWTANDWTAQRFSTYWQNDVVMPTGLSIGDTELELRPGDTAEMEAVFTPSTVASSRRGVTWSSSNEAVLTVSAGGVIQAVGEGTAVLTATSVYNPSLSAKRSVKVQEALEKPEITTVTVTGYTAHVEWTASPLINGSDVRSYEVSVYPKGNLSDCLWSDGAVNDTSCDITLSGHGEYRVFVRAVNTAANVYSKYTSRSFTVLDGEWQYANALPEDLDPNTAEIQYRNFYEQISESSPGDGWVQGSAASTHYENVGEPYFSTRALDTSDTRVLVSSSPYHYCGDTTGGRVDFWQHDGFDTLHNPSTWDAFDITGGPWADDDDPSYLAYNLRWRSGEYAGHDATCWRGINVWYQGYTYQDRRAVTSYTWTKDSGWVNTADAAATSTELRFRLLDNALPEINSVEVTAVRPDGFILTVSASDDQGITKVVFDGRAENSTVTLHKEKEPDSAGAQAAFLISEWENETDANYFIRVSVVDIAGHVVEYPEEVRVFVPFLMSSRKVLTLPAELVRIEASAFEGGLAFGKVVLPEGVKSIGSRAFADCPRLVAAYMPDSLTEIAPDAFEDSDNVVLLCQSNNRAAAYARQNGIPYVTEGY